MCFFKTLEFSTADAIEPCQLNCHQLEYPLIPLFPYFNPPIPTLSQTSIPISACLPFYQAVWAFLPQICARIHANNQKINLFEEKLSKNEKLLQKADNQILQILQKTPENISVDDREQLPLGNRKKTLQNRSLLLTKMFGERTYRYRLYLKVDFPKIIYKQRRLALSIKLVTHENKVVRNANLMHLCLAACDLDGKWIIGQDEDFFMLGRTEVDLYKGEAEFQKVYPADISRHSPGGKIALIIYPKSSLLNLTGDVQRGDVVINHEDIEPLCLQNILVKAKKRLKY